MPGRIGLGIADELAEPLQRDRIVGELLQQRAPDSSRYLPLYR
jgi:hypothetical protein